MDVQSNYETVALKGNFFSEGLTDDMQICIQNCQKCVQACEQLIQHCLSMGGLHSETRHIRLLQDCADICDLSARFMSRNSEHHTRTCEACALVCLSCAQDCERFGHDEMMKACAHICLANADSCQRMSLTH